MLEIRHLTAGYGEREIVRDASFCVQPGKLTILLGPNGCGKSTLLKAVCGLAEAKGERLLDNESLSSLPRQLLAQRIAYLAQSRQTPDITVSRLVLHGRFPYLSYPRRYRSEDYAAAARAMEEMELSVLEDTPLAELSGGQRQKAYIAMALAQDTPVLLLDEPTTYLDMAHQLQLLRLARELAHKGRHVLMVLHDVPQALETADSVVLMENGGIRMQDTAEAVYDSGQLERIFGVKISRLPSGNRWRYFMDEA